jgi:hypothetical protein
VGKHEKTPRVGKTAQVTGPVPFLAVSSAAPHQSRHHPPWPAASRVPPLRPISCAPASADPNAATVTTSGVLQHGKGCGDWRPTSPVATETRAAESEISALGGASFRVHVR